MLIASAGFGTRVKERWKSYKKSQADERYGGQEDAAEYGGCVGVFCLVVGGGLRYGYGEGGTLILKSGTRVWGSGMSFRIGGFEASGGRRRENEGWFSRVLCENLEHRKFEAMRIKNVFLKALHV